jgi:tRNA1Val (adenine37-N6)-methyltransferase
VGLLLAWARPDLAVTALEVQPGLAELAWRNAWLNGLQDRLAVVRGDLRQADLFPPAAFPAIAANPPYYSLGSGRLGSEPARNLARHELAGTLAEWVAAASRWLTPAGRSWWVIKPARLAELLGRLEGEGLWPSRLRPVWDSPAGPEALVLVEARPDRPAEVQTEGPIFLRPGPGARTWTEEMAGLLSGRLSGAV